VTLPDHGTQTRVTTYGCSCESCRKAQTRYVKGWRLARSRGVEFVVDSAPTRRKVQALQAMGHSLKVIADEIGITRAALGNMLKNDRIRPATAARVDSAYRALEMKIPPDNRWTRRIKREASGWPPPLAWEDIDAGILAEAPPLESLQGRLDFVEIEYALQYNDFSRPLSPLEKAEIVRLWTRSGRSEASLCTLTGWRPGRYSSNEPTQEAS